MRVALSVLLAGLPLAVPAAAQQSEMTDVTIQNHVYKPAQVEPTDERIGQLDAPEGFTVTKFVDGVENPRMLAVADDGTVYATRRDQGDLLMMRDDDRDGQADGVRVVARRPDMHGIAIDGDRMYLATVNEVFVADINEDGTPGRLETIIDDLPDGGQHPNRTLAMGPDGMLYISVGSTCNSCPETSDESATILRTNPDGSDRQIFASGLRNTIGFGWHPETGALYGMDHGIDWLGDREQPEEMNRLEEGKKYGWPFVFADAQINPSEDDPDGSTKEEWAAGSTDPVQMYAAHAAPMQMAFYDGDAFPEEYRGDAFVAMRGSWNRKPPSGYEVVRIRFEDGEPMAIEPFLTGFLIERPDGGHEHFARIAGLAVTPDGALLVSDDTNGVIYRVAYEGAQQAERPQQPQQ